MDDRIFNRLSELTWSEAQSEFPERKGDELFFYQWNGAHWLVGISKDYETTKEKDLILKAMFICSLLDVKIPKWCADAFVDAMMPVISYGAKSWDEIFGRPHPKGTQLAVKKDQERDMRNVYYTIQKAAYGCPIDPGTKAKIPIDESLFQKIGLELGIGGKTKTSDLYYRFKKRIDAKFAEK